MDLGPCGKGLPLAAPPPYLDEKQPRQQLLHPNTTSPSPHSFIVAACHALVAAEPSTHNTSCLPTYVRFQLNVAVSAVSNGAH
jgi:hypothetical protein